MAMPYEEVESLALELDADQRERLAMRLLHDVEMDPEITPEMLAEWHRRADEGRANPQSNISAEVWEKKWRERLGR
jgi:hypothetical protein